MPEQQPAKSFLGFTWGSEVSGASQEERPATPEELAEYGALGPDPDTEAKILALFEEQLLQDLIRELPAETAIPDAPAAATETQSENPVKVNGSAEAQKTEPVAEVLEEKAEVAQPETAEAMNSIEVMRDPEQTVDWLIEEMQKPV